VLTLGAAGAVAAAPSGDVWRIGVPPVPDPKPIGSGDAFSAGLITAIAEGASLERALSRAAAAGTANALRLGAGILEAETIRRLESEVAIARVGR
jgi:tagatose 6-phosphate kinase